MSLRGVRGARALASKLLRRRSGRQGTGRRLRLDPSLHHRLRSAVERAEPTPDTSTMQRLRGQLLISGGGLFDPNFRHTVVRVGQHNADGALGVVLNRALDVTVGEAVAPLAELVGGEQLLYQGGPV